jgi:7-keto-8-aminopelargonate synthetase-like enzyme
MAHFNISRIRTDSEPLARLRNATAAMKESLQELGIDTGNNRTPILPILLGESERAILCADALFKKNIVAAAIRPPTVPEGTARIRVSVSAAHRIPDLKKAASIISEILPTKRS